MKFKYYFLMIIFLSCQDKTDRKIDIGIIKYDRFKEITIASTKAMCDTAHLTIDKAIKIVKMINTIQQYSLSNKDSAFYKAEVLFPICSFEKIISILEMNLSVGMSYYSQKYDLYLGAFDSATNSYYLIDMSSIPK